jgi:hypothetical protein
MFDAELHDPAVGRQRHRPVGTFRRCCALAACLGCAVALLSSVSDRAHQHMQASTVADPVVSPGVEGNAEHGSFAVVVWSVGTEGAAEHARGR